jgi:opacity protein-like surface antigen
MITSKPLCRVACALALSACVASPALAKESGFYLGAAVGQSTYDIGVDQIYTFPIPTGTNTEESDTSYSLATGYRFNRYLGVDLSLNDFGNYTESGTGFTSVSPSIGGYEDSQLGTRGVALAVVGTLPLGKFELYGKLGAIYAETETSIRIAPTFGTWPVGTTGLGSISSKSTQVLYGVGAGYEFGDDFFVKLEYLLVPQLGVEEDFGVEEDISVDVISIGFDFRF